MYFLLILSHSKSKFRDIQRSKLKNKNFIYYYFIGDKDLDRDYLVDDDNNIVYLNIPDNYESLSLKTFNALKYISENYPHIDGVFKTDDDIELDLDILYDFINMNKGSDYFGLAINSPNYLSDYHFGKCEDNILNQTRVDVPSCVYCAGGGYFLSKNSIKKILNNKDIFQKIIFEDVSIGVAMNKEGIYPTNVNIKNNGCRWGVVESTLNENNVIRKTHCRCGTLMDRVRYNFCQKCGNLY